MACIPLTLQLSPSLWPQSTMLFLERVTCFPTPLPGYTVPFARNTVPQEEHAACSRASFSSVFTLFPSPSLTTLVHLCLVPQPNFKIFSVLPSPRVPIYDQIHYRAFVVYVWSPPFRIGSAQETGTFLPHLICMAH